MIFRSYIYLSIYYFIFCLLRKLNLLHVFTIYIYIYIYIYICMYVYIYIYIYYTYIYICIFMFYKCCILCNSEQYYFLDIHRFIINIMCT